MIDVYELIINGQEISPGYSELNDPDVQRRRLQEQTGGEAQEIDEDFVEALEHGMPPAGGIGIGIDRLIMLLTGALNHPRRCPVSSAQAERLNAWLLLLNSPVAET